MLIATSCSFLPCIGSLSPRVFFSFSPRVGRGPHEIVARARAAALFFPRRTIIAQHKNRPAKTTHPERETRPPTPPSSWPASAAAAVRHAFARAMLRRPKCLSSGHPLLPPFRFVIRRAARLDLSSASSGLSLQPRCAYTRRTAGFSQRVFFCPSRLLGSSVQSCAAA